MVQPHLSTLSGERWQPAEQVLPKSSFLRSSQRIREQLASQWKLLGQAEASPSLKKALPLLLLSQPFLSLQESSSGSALRGAVQQRTFAATGNQLSVMEKPTTYPLLDLLMCLYNVTLQCSERPLPLWQHAPSHSSFALSSSPLLFRPLVFAGLARKWTIT